MSDAGSGAEDPVVTATDLLAYDEEQLVGYLKTHDHGAQFDISSLAGVESLSRSQRDDLSRRLSKAGSLLPLAIDELQARLQNVPSEKDDPPDFVPSRLQSDSIASTPPPVAVENLETSCLQELIRDGGRPVCSVQELSHILAAPMARYDVVLSWLTDFPDSETGDGEIKTVFSRQFMRWWSFRKSQWHSRGLGDTEVGFSAFLEASERKYEGMGLKAMVSEPSFDETIRRQWQQMPTSQPPESQTFSAYHNAVKTRLTPYHFAPSLQLRKDPQKQTAWTDWLEYLSFEMRYLEFLTLATESLEMEYHQSTERLLRAKQPNGNKAASSSAASDSTHSRQRCPREKGVNMAKELAAARADRDASQKSIDDFIRETRPYRQSSRAAFYQKHRVAWVIKEARLMGSEMSL